MIAEAIWETRIPVIRAVLDTNVLSSYLLAHRPPIATLIDRYLAEVVDPRGVIPRICRHPDDDQVIACAVTAGGDAVIVSGNRDLLALEQVGRIPVLSAAQFLEG